MNYVLLFLQGVIVLIVAGLAFYIRNITSERTNEIKIMDWLASMDVIQDGQRWRGSRSVLIEVFGFNKSLTGIEAKLLCVTQSGRWFWLNINSNMGVVGRWKLQPVRAYEVAEELDVEESIIKETWKSIKWAKEIRAASVSPTKTANASKTMTLAETGKIIEDANLA